MEKQPSSILQHALHTPVNFFIIPLFALANTAIHLPRRMERQKFLVQTVWEYLLVCSWENPWELPSSAGWALLLGIARLPEGMNTTKLIGMGLLAGIGFTMSIFISNLAFPFQRDTCSKFQSGRSDSFLLAAVLGWIMLKVSVRNRDIR